MELVSSKTPPAPGCVLSLAQMPSPSVPGSAYTTEYRGAPEPLPRSYLYPHLDISLQVICGKMQTPGARPQPPPYTGTASFVIHSTNSNAHLVAGSLG